MQIKVGIGQIRNSTQIRQNFSEIMSLLSSFQDTGVRLVVFPECSLSGFTAKMKSWKIPLLQSNFASNNLEGHAGSGPEGLSFVVGHDNRLISRGPHLEVGGFIVELSKRENQSQVSECFPLELKNQKFDSAKCPAL